MSAATTLAPAVFLLPDLGEGLTEAEVMEWHVAVGDEVVVDQVVVTVETAKATVDLPCPHAGRVHQLHGEPGQLLAVGSPLLSVSTGGSAPSPRGSAVASGDAYRGWRRRRAGGPRAVPRGGAGRVRRRAHRVRDGPGHAHPPAPGRRSGFRPLPPLPPPRSPRLRPPAVRPRPGRARSR